MLAYAYSLDSVNDAGESVLSIAHTRGHVDLIDYLVKEKGCDPDGEIAVLWLITADHYCFDLFTQSPLILLVIV